MKLSSQTVLCIVPWHDWVLSTLHASLVPGLLHGNEANFMHMLLLGRFGNVLSTTSTAQVFI